MAGNLQGKTGRFREDPCRLPSFFTSPGGTLKLLLPIGRGGIHLTTEMKLLAKSARDVKDGALRQSFSRSLSRC